MSKPKKHLGQNFLINQGVLKNISQAVDSKGKDVIEVGPGHGALTQYLVDQKPKTLNLIELDSELIPELEEKFDQKHIKIHHADVLKTDLSQGGLSEYLVFGNIPYYITSPILSHFMYDVQITPQKMIILMQKEVADKILKRDGKNSVLSLMIELRTTSVKKLMDVSPGSFNPPPKVTSSVLIFDINQQRNREEEQKFLTLIKAGFSEKRKKLMKNLERHFHSGIDWKSVFQELEIDPGIRAEKLDLQTWKRLLVHT